MKNYAELLKKHGLKATFQRMTILSAIHDLGHANVDEIYAKVWPSDGNLPAAVADDETPDGTAIASAHVTILNAVSGVAVLPVNARTGDDLGLYSEAGIVHPAVWPGLANSVVKRNLVEGPWVHTRSRIRHHGTARVGATALVEAVVVDRFETRSGSRAVLDIRISVDGELVASLEHEALVSLHPQRRP